jgi:hypothetical protein
MYINTLSVSVDTSYQHFGQRPRSIIMLSNQCTIDDSSVVYSDFNRLRKPWPVSFFSVMYLGWGLFDYGFTPKSEQHCLPLHHHYLNIPRLTYKSQGQP